MFVYSYVLQWLRIRDTGAVRIYDHRILAQWDRHEYLQYETALLFELTRCLIATIIADCRFVFLRILDITTTTKAPAFLQSSSTGKGVHLCILYGVISRT